MNLSKLKKLSWLRSLVGEQQADEDLSSCCEEPIGFPLSSKTAKSGVRLVGLEVGSGAAVPRASESSSRIPTGCPSVVA